MFVLHQLCCADVADTSKSLHEPRFNAEKLALSQIHVALSTPKDHGNENRGSTVMGSVTGLNKLEHTLALSLSPLSLGRVRCFCTFARLGLDLRSQR